MTTLAAILAACLVAALLSLGLSAAIAMRAQPRWIPTLVSYAVGALLGAVFLDVLPHLFEASKQPARIGAFILCGILAFFLLEKLLLWRHHHHLDDEERAHHASHGHDLGRSGMMIVVGDAFHNFTDGVIIATAFMADMRLGVVTSIAIVAHEIPQEIGDFIVLLHSGYTRARALLLNAVSGLSTIAGALLAYFALQPMKDLLPDILAVACAGMIYVAVADLIPGLHKRTRLSETAAQAALIALGVFTIWVIHASLHAE